MDYKTILVHVDGSRHAAARIRYAAALARDHDACLLGVAFTGVSRAVFPTGFDIRPDTLGASYFGPLAENCRRALAAFEVLAQEAGVAYEARTVCDQPDDGLAQLARFVDLLVLTQDDPDEAPAGNVVRIPDYVILHCARPVLVLPRDHVPTMPPRHVMLAWDGSKEASFAASAALPLSCRATAVTVTELADAADGDIDTRLADLRTWLARHGVKADVLAQGGQGDQGRALLDLARVHGYDLLVMGCYGHSRLRELCLGGTSRTVLEDASMPVLFAH